MEKCISIFKLILLLGIGLSLSLSPKPSSAYEYKELPGIKGYKAPPGWPWSPPFTGEQLLYRADRRHFYFCGCYQLTYSILVNARGHMRQQNKETIGEPLGTYGDMIYPGGGKLKAGDVKARFKMSFSMPPELKGKAMLSYDYLDTPDLRKDADRWIYSPAKRRVMRIAGGGRSDSVGGQDICNDDTMGREVFEQEAKVLGMDVLQPQELGWDKYFWSSVPEKPIECYVVEATSKLPDYYISRRILWIDKDEYFVVREEQFDRKGSLWKILSNYSGPDRIGDPPYVFHYEKPDSIPVYFGQKPARTSKQTYMSFRNVWDLKIDHRTLMYFFNKTFLPDNYYSEDYEVKKAFDPPYLEIAKYPFVERYMTPEALPEEYFEFPGWSGTRVINSLEVLPPKPPILSDRKIREITLPK